MTSQNPTFALDFQGDILAINKSVFCREVIEAWLTNHNICSAEAEDEIPEASMCESLFG